jgi:hypothetical protein
MDFPLITFDPNTGLAQVGMPDAPRAVVGIDKLVQIVTIGILKNRGQDIFTPSEGTGLRSLIGQFNFFNPEEVKVEVIQRIKSLEQQIINNQIGVTVPASEKLVKLRVLTVVSDSTTGSLAVRIQIFNEAGQSTVAVV